VAESLCADGHRLVLLGQLAWRHGAYADLRAMAAELARLTGAVLGVLADGGNAAGAALAGAVPHRQAGGGAARSGGLDVSAMLTSPLRAYLLFGGIEPEYDIAAPAAAATLQQAGFVAAATPYATEAMKQWADVLLPIGTFAETSGTFVNAEGRWQSWAGCIKPLGEARPGWKVLRVLGNLLALDGFDYDGSVEVREELKRLLVPVDPSPVTREIGITAVASQRRIPIYGGDPVVRRAEPLQQSAVARAAG
jgi:NADH-quinone oxidoreductase subunit G